MDLTVFGRTDLYGYVSDECLNFVYFNTILNSSQRYFNRSCILGLVEQLKINLLIYCLKRPYSVLISLYFLIRLIFNYMFEFGNYNRLTMPAVLALSLISKCATFRIRFVARMTHPCRFLILYFCFINLFWFHSSWLKHALVYLFFVI